MILPAALAAAVPQLVDCIAAEVNSRAITLTDVRILQAFDFEGRREAGAPAPAPAEILRRAIDRQVVVEMLRESLPISREEEDIRLKSLKGRFAPAEWQRLLETFGIIENDLRSYLQKFLQYERMIAIRFGRTVDISVREIQDYYDTEYIPAQRSAGLEPKPLVGVLSEIEERLKERKRESQVSAWIQDLRSQAEIRVHQECLDRLK
jgi:hypothetical protein